MPIPKDETNTERAISVAFNFRQKRHEYTCAQNLAAECGTQMQEIQKDWIEAERWVLTAERDVEAAEKELDALTKTHVDAIDDALKRKEAELLEV